MGVVIKTYYRVIKAAKQSHFPWSPMNMLEQHHGADSSWYNALRRDRNL
jgi:hypothetical protein